MHKENLTMNSKHDYQLYLQQLQQLLCGEDDEIATLSNTSAFLYECIDNLNWCGFYILRNNQLVLGPFQGKVACTRIDLDKGVCGYSATKKQSVIVGNVHEFDGHIACDSASNSELVVPIVLSDNLLYGVIDIDSFELNNFTKEHKEFIENVAKLISEKISDNS